MVVMLLALGGIAISTRTPDHKWSDVINYLHSGKYEPLGNRGGFRRSRDREFHWRRGQWIGQIKRLYFTDDMDWYDFVDRNGQFRVAVYHRDGLIRIVKVIPQSTSDPQAYALREDLCSEFPGMPCRIIAQ